jgi:hypothetical protein
MPEAGIQLIVHSIVRVSAEKGAIVTPHRDALHEPPARAAQSLVAMQQLLWYTFKQEIETVP